MLLFTIGPPLFLHNLGLDKRNKVCYTCGMRKEDNQMKQSSMSQAEISLWFMRQRQDIEIKALKDMNNQIKAILIKQSNER